MRDWSVPVKVAGGLPARPRCATHVRGALRVPITGGCRAARWPYGPSSARNAFWVGSREQPESQGLSVSGGTRSRGWEFVVGGFCLGGPGVARRRIPAPDVGLWVKPFLCLWTWPGKIIFFLRLLFFYEKGNTVQETLFQILLTFHFSSLVM